MATSTEETLALAIGGDEPALIRLLRTHGPQVRAGLTGKIPACYQSVLSEDDVMQVTYMDAFLSIRSFQPQGPAAFPAWLARIAQNNLLTAIHALAAQRRPDPRERVQLPRGDESCVALLDALCSTKSSPSRSAARHEARFILEEAIGQLAEAHRQVVRLYDLEGRPAAAVAAAMGRSEGAIYMLRARAHEQLREILGSSSGFFSDAS